MIIQCPKCGEKVAVNGLGRRRLNIPLKNVYECLRKHRSVGEAASELGCSQGYIFKVLKDNGLRLRDILKATLPLRHVMGKGGIDEYKVSQYERKAP